MSLTLLFDLDDTLLDTNIETFVPAYFQALLQHLEKYVLPTVMLRALVKSMSRMNDNADPALTLQSVFDAGFYEQVGVPKQELAEALDDFYDNVFPQIESTTTRRPDAAPLIEWAFSQGYRIAIATDPFLSEQGNASSFALGWACSHGKL